MSQDSGSEQRQRTVAELLAQYGEAGGGAEPKRRRRRAEDASDDTAPQAIIDRVMSDSGRMRPVSDEQADGVPDAQRTSTQEPVQPPPQDDGRAVPPPAQTRRARRAPTRFGDPTANPPAPPAPAGPPPDARQTQQQPAVPPPATTHPSMPPAGNGTQQPPISPQANRTQQQAPVPPPAAGQSLPPAAEQASGPNNLRSRLGGRPAESRTEQFPAVAEDGDGTGGQPPAGLRDSSPLGRGAAGLEQTQAGLPPVEQDDDLDDADLGDEYDEYDDYDDLDDYDDYEDGDGAGRGRDTDAEEHTSSGRDWVMLVGLIAASVLGGAAVWLGFDWLWGEIPAAALVGALVVIAGMVWVVRRVRNDDDLQTTVFSVLVGLIVTVSPAALLLLEN